MALLKNTQREQGVMLVAGTEMEVKFDYVYNNNIQEYPNTFVIRQFGGSNPVLLSDKRGQASSRTLQTVPVGSDSQYVNPYGCQYLYLYCAGNADVEIMSWVDTDSDVAGLGVTQNVTITNSTTTSSVVIADGGDSAQGSINDIAKTNSGVSGTMISWLKGLISLSNTITGQIVSVLNKQDTSNGLLTTIDTDTSNIDTKLSTTNALLTTIDTDSGNIATYTNSVDTKLTSTNALLTTGNSNTSSTASNISTLVSSIVALPTTPIIYHVTITSANTEYSQSLPPNTQRFSCGILGGSGANNYRISFQTGKVATPTSPYLQYMDNVEYSETDLNLTDKTIYVACSSASQVFQIIVWA